MRQLYDKCLDFIAMSEERFTERQTAVRESAARLAEAVAQPKANSFATPPSSALNSPLGSSGRPSSSNSNDKATNAAARVPQIAAQKFVE